MYPSGELNQLALHKARLRLRISHRRDELAIAAAEAARPLEWLDRAVAWWRKVKPVAKLAAIPLSLLVKRVLFTRLRIFTSLLRWGPAIFGAMRLASAWRRSQVQFLSE